VGLLALIMLQLTRERNKREKVKMVFLLHWGLISIMLVWFLFIPISQNSFFFLFLVEFHETGCTM
jgi:hypothetical protein